MKIRTTSNAPGYMRKFQRAIVASAIATFLGACAGATGEETGNGGITGATPGLGAAVEVSEGDQTGIDVDSTTDTVEIPDVDPTTVIVEIPEVDSTTDTVEIPEVESTSSTPDNALGLIQAHPELGLFATAIQSSGLVKYLADPGQRVTLFALSNKAFESLSTTQRDALFNDPDRLNTLVRSTTIHDTRITASTAGVVDDTQALSNGSLTIEREGDMISVATSDYYSTVAVEVTSTLVSDEVAIHIIDDFINIPATFFPPDPGSIMERLLADGTSRFSDNIRVTRWYRELGNSEGEWTVFVPSVFSTSDIEPYIVSSTANGPIIFEAGTLTSVDGSSHVIENVDGAWTFDNREISEFYALQVNNGHVHRLAWSLGVDGHPTADPGVGGSVYDTIVQSTEHTSLRAAIDAAGLADILDDESKDFTVFAPNNAAFDALTVVPAGDELLRVLDFHVLEGTFDAAALTELVGLAEDGNASLPTLLADGLLTFTPSAEGQGLAVNDVAIIAFDLLPEVAEVEATTGIVHSIGAVLTPPETNITEAVDPVDTSGAVDATLAAAGNYEIFRTAVTRDFGESLENAAWTVFVPSDAILDEAGMTDLTASQQQSHIIASGALDLPSLTAMATVTASNNIEYVVTSNGTTTFVDGKAIVLLATGAGGAQIYSIDGVL